jgi:osmotically-inducible protein OsmY
VGVGLLIAPMTGDELRTRLRHLIEQRRGTGDLAERVRFELSHSPRTWHLPQPDVEVIGGTAILRGEVPHEVGRADLERTAAAVAGVVHVENQVDVAGGNGQH